MGEDGQLVGGYLGVYTREICGGPSEKIGVLFKDAFDVVLFSFGEGGANLEESILLFEGEVSYVPNGLDPGFGVYSGVEVVACQGCFGRGLLDIVGCQGWVGKF